MTETTEQKPVLNGTARTGGPCMPDYRTYIQLLHMAMGNGMTIDQAANWVAECFGFRGKGQNEH